MNAIQTLQVDLSRIKERRRQAGNEECFNTRMLSEDVEYLKDEIKARYERKLNRR